MSTIEKGFGDAFKADNKTERSSHMTPTAGGTSGHDPIELSPVQGDPAAPPMPNAGGPTGPTPIVRPNPTTHGVHDPSPTTRREPVRATAVPYTQAVNEAYHPPIESEDDGEFDLTAYLRVIRRHRWGIVTVVLLALMIGLLNAFSSTPTFRAKTTLIAEPFQRKVTVEDEYINSAAVYLFYDTQFEILQSRALAERVVDDLDLVTHARDEATRLSADNDEGNGSLAAIIATFRSWFDWQRWLGGDKTATTKAVPSDEMMRQLLANEVQANLSVEGGKQSQIIHLYYDHESPNEAARRANALARAYVGYGADNRTESSQRTNQWLTDQIAEIKEKLRVSESALLDYKEAHRMVDTNKQTTLVDARLRDITAKLVAAKSLRAEAELRYQQVTALSATDAKRIEALDGIRTDANVTKIAFEVRSIERDLGELKARVTDNHPDLKLMKARLTESRAALQREVSKIAANRRNDFEIADTRVREIETLMAAEKDQIGAATTSAMELVRLEREVENNRKLYEALLVRLQEADVTSDLDTTNIQILDTAKPPLVPFKPNKIRIIAIAAVLGLMLGVLLAFLREHLDRSLKSPDDIQDKLGLTALGVVPLVPDPVQNNPDTAFFDDPRSAFAEKVNHVRTGLLFSSIDHPPQTILITSATGGEGKTTAAINLAASFSQLGKTLLVEVDLRKPTLLERLSTNQPLGLTDLMLNTGLANEVIVPFKGSENLRVLTCGTQPRNPLELLSSQHFRNLLAQLRKHFRYIVLDGPPVLAVSDAAVVGNVVDSTIVVAKAESTPLKMVADGVALLRKAHVTPEGVILSQADGRRMAYYGGHYRYDERYYGKRPDDDPARA